jgi:hypothetical protein
MAVRGDEDVGGLEVAVDHTALMGPLDGFADRLHQLEDLPLWELMTGHVLIEGHTVDQLHRIVIGPLEQPALVNPGDVGVFETRGQFDLALEPSAGLL